MPAFEYGWRRFWRYVNKTDGCWEWTGAHNGHGYGQLRMGDRVVFAHRMSWEMRNGPIPSRMVVCHRCDNPRCVNPDHLFIGTQKDNVADMIAKGRAPRTPRKTHCKHGHAFTPENTMRGKGGAQRCRECENGRRRKPGGRGAYNMRNAA